MNVISIPSGQTEESFVNAKIENAKHQLNEFNSYFVSDIEYFDKFTQNHINDILSQLKKLKDDLESLKKFGATRSV